MSQLFADWAYILERHFPNLRGAGDFFLCGLFVVVGFGFLYAMTRKKIHLLPIFAVVLYLLPFIF
jgi:hypothetical protein